MFFAASPDARHAAIVDYVRHRAAALRRAAPGQPPLPVTRPVVSRFLVAGICAWLLWQPLAVKGAEPLPPTIGAAEAGDVTQQQQQNFSFQSKLR